MAAAWHLACFSMAATQTNDRRHLECYPAGQRSPPGRLHCNHGGRSSSARGRSSACRWRRLRRNHSSARGRSSTRGRGRLRRGHRTGRPRRRLRQLDRRVGNVYWWRRWWIRLVLILVTWMQEAALVEPPSSKRIVAREIVAAFYATVNAAAVADVQVCCL